MVRLKAGSRRKDAGLCHAGAVRASGAPPRPRAGLPAGCRAQLAGVGGVRRPLDPKHRLIGSVCGYSGDSLRSDA